MTPEPTPAPLSARIDLTKDVHTNKPERVLTEEELECARDLYYTINRPNNQEGDRAAHLLFTLDTKQAELDEYKDEIMPYLEWVQQNATKFGGLGGEPLLRLWKEHTESLASQLAAAEKGRAELEPVLCSVRLPEKAGYYLCFYKSEEWPRPGQFSFFKNGGHFHEDTLHYRGKPIAWMSMPTLKPKEPTHDEPR